MENFLEKRRALVKRIDPLVKKLSNELKESGITFEFKYKLPDRDICVVFNPLTANNCTVQANNMTYSLAYGAYGVEDEFSLKQLEEAVIGVEENFSTLMREINKRRQVIIKKMWVKRTEEGKLYLYEKVPTGGEENINHLELPEYMYQKIDKGQTTDAIVELRIEVKNHDTFDLPK